MPNQPPRFAGQNTHRKNRKSKDRVFRLQPSLLIVLIPLALAGISAFTATRFENHDSFCASCHTQPETEYFKRATSVQPADLASFHAQKNSTGQAEAARCIDCHSGSGPVGRASALFLGAHDMLAFITHTDKQPAPLTRPIGDANCLKCHLDVTQRQDFNNHFHVFLIQWQMRDPQAATCVDCHQAHTTNGTADIGFLNQETTTQVCQRCHEAVGGG